MKKLERQRAQEEQAKRQQEEEAAAQREDQGEQAGSWAGQPVSYLGGALETSGCRRPDGETEAQRLGETRKTES